MPPNIIWKTYKDYSEYPEIIKKHFFNNYLDVRKKYTIWVGKISKNFSKDIDWWSSLPASRNPNSSKLFNYICILETLKSLKNKKITIVTESKNFYELLLNNFSKNKNFEFVYKKKIKPLYLTKFLISSFFQLFIFVLIRIFFNNKNKIENKTLINTYFNYVNNKIERQFVFSPSFKKKNKKNYVFIPTFIPTKKIFTLVRCLVLANKENYFFKESVLSINDLIYSFFYIFRKKKFNKKYPKFKNFDLSKVIFDDIKNLKYFHATMTGILNFIFVNKILKKNLKISKSVSWLENHELKGWNMAFRNSGKNIKIVGYQGFTHLPQLMNTIPAKYENDYKVIPNEIIISGKAYKNSRKEFYKNLKIQVGPALVYQDLFKKTNVKKTNLFLLILTEFRYNNSQILNWIEYAISKNKTLKFIIKKPKILNVDDLLQGFKYKNNIKVFSDKLYPLLSKSRYVIISGATSATPEAIAYNCNLLLPENSPYDKKYFLDLNIPKKKYEFFHDMDSFTKKIKFLKKRNFIYKKKTSKTRLKNYLFEKTNKSNEKIFI